MFEQKVQKMRKDFEALANLVARGGHLYASVAAELGDPLFDMYLDPSWVSLNVTGDYEVLLRTIRVLRRYGFASKMKPEANSPEFNAFFTHQSDAPDARVQIFLIFTSTCCRRVKVGSKVTTEPIYEIVCGEPPTLIDAPAEGVELAF